MRRALLFLPLPLLVAAATFWSLYDPKSDPDTLTLYGNVELRQVSLAFEQSERIVAVHVEEGERVDTGQVVATLDSRTLQLQLTRCKAQVAALEQVWLRLKNGARAEEIEQAKAQVAAAQAEADLANQQLKRLEQIATNSSGRAISQQELDSALAQARVADAQLQIALQAQCLVNLGPRQEEVAQAQAQLEVARAEQALLEHQLELTQLRAAQPGVVHSRLLEPGEIASPQRPVYSLALTDPKWVRCYLNEPQLGQIKPGLSAHIYTDSHPKQPIAGRVGYISQVAEFTPKSVQTEELRTALVYEVRILVEDPQDRLRLGMPATVQIDLQPPKPQSTV